MLRRLFAILSAVSLLLCVATGVLWVRSYFGGDLVFLKSSRDSWLHTSRGSVFLVAELKDSGRQGEKRRLGFGAAAGRDWEMNANGNFQRRDYRWLWFVPLWVPCAVLALPPLVHLTRFVQRRRRRIPGLCPACGYDLRATPGRCPECGRAATVAT